MDVKKTYIIGVAAIVLATTIISVTAQKPKEPKVDEVEFLLQKSQEQMKQATKMAKASQGYYRFCPCCCYSF